MKKIWVAALAVSCVGVIANADDLPSANQAPLSDSIKNSAAVPSSPVENLSQSNAEPSAYDYLSKHFEATYWGDYRGGNFGQYGNGLQPDVAGNPDNTSPQGIESYATLGWKPATDWMIGVNTHFFWNESDSVAPAAQALGSGFELMNPAFVITKKNLINTGQFKVKGYFYAQVPLSSYDYISLPGNNMLTALQPTLNMTYDIKGTRWTLGLYNYIIAYIPGPNTPDGLRTYKLYSAPYVNYQMTPTVAATMWVDLVQSKRYQGSAFIGGMKNDTADIEPGVAWDVVPGLTLNPMLNIYPAHATMASTSLQMVIIGKAL